MSKKSNKSLRTPYDTNSLSKLKKEIMENQEKINQKKKKGKGRRNGYNWKNKMGKEQD